MAEPIQTKIQRYYALIVPTNNQSGPNTRYKSWEWCHDAFLKQRQSQKPDIDLLSLHLAFYLASWGMYRGSSFLLQMDYKAHINAVKIILDKSYSDLWNYDPSSHNAISIVDANDLIFGSCKGVYWKIKKSYPPATPTDTLVTKILMGTFACIPAFDRFLKNGIVQCIKAKSNGINSKIGGYTLSSSIEKINNGNATGTDTFKALATFAKNHHQSFMLSGASYPLMKCVDMYFWQVGFEMNMAQSLINKKNSFGTKKSIYQRATNLGLVKQGSNPTSLTQKDFLRVSGDIKNLNI